ncbi:O-antigen polymerase [Aeromonas sp. R6-1]|uniref:O-antigen polymerase n=1 Tax=Aeromonas sp. R6-1 TaxID=3138471 RepID=UPI0034A3B9BF
MNETYSKNKKKASTLILIYVAAFFFTSLVLGRVFINYTDVSFINITLYICCFLMFAIGAYIGEKTNCMVGGKINISLLSIIKLYTWIAFLGTIICWYYNIKHWGTLSYIISNAMVVRENSIGGGANFIPSIWSYLASLSYLSFLASLLLFNEAEKKISTSKKLIYVIINFVLIILLDMIYFGRVGAVFSLLTIVAYVAIFKPWSVVFNKKALFILIFMAALVNVPRMIRGGEDLFLASMDDKVNSLNVPVNVYTAGPIINYIYFFSSPYAFNEWMDNEYNNVQFSYGARTLTPFYNIVQKIYGDDSVNIIDENAYIPFRHNIFSVAKDYYCDFGILGIFIIPLIIGFWCGRSLKSFYLTREFYKVDYSYAMMGIFWLSYILYAPIYNILSFGKFFIPLILMFLLNVFFRVK